MNGLKILEIPFTPREVSLLLNYLCELEHWNKSYGFVRASGNDLIIRHVLDSLTGLKMLLGLPHPDRVIDIGSGAGFPGLPLAIFMKKSSLTLLERSVKKAAFLRNVSILLGLVNIDVVEKDLKEVEKGFDVVTFRAFSPLDRELENLKKILLPGGSIVAYKGKRSRIDRELSELSKIEDIIVSVQRVNVPFLQEERHLVLIRFKG